MTMNKYIYLILIFLIIFSCSLESKNQNKKKIIRNLYLYTRTYDVNQDSILVKIFIAFVCRIKLFWTSFLNSFGLLAIISLAAL